MRWRWRYACGSFASYVPLARQKAAVQGGYLELLENPSKVMFTNHHFDGIIVVSVVELVGEVSSNRKEQNKMIK